LKGSANLKKFIPVYEENNAAETACKGLVNVDHITLIQEYRDDTRGIGGRVFYEGWNHPECGFVTTRDFAALVGRTVDE